MTGELAAHVTCMPIGVMSVDRVNLAERGCQKFVMATAMLKVSRR